MGSEDVSGGASAESKAAEGVAVQKTRTLGKGKKGKKKKMKDAKHVQPHTATTKKKAPAEIEERADHSAEPHQQEQVESRSPAAQLQ